jgi:hypothetical protein
MGSGDTFVIDLVASRGSLPQGPGVLLRIGFGSVDPSGGLP